jgi:phage shock protein E
MNPLKLLKSMFRSAPRLAAADCIDRVRSGAALLIDVREPGETRSGAAQGAKLLPLSDLTGGRRKWSEFLTANVDRDLLLYCGAGVRSGMAARILRSEGFRAINAGSFGEWSAAGWPVVQSDTEV